MFELDLSIVIDGYLSASKPGRQRTPKCHTSVIQKERDKPEKRWCNFTPKRFGSIISPAIIVG